MLDDPHPWNADPLPPRRFRLTIVHQRNKDNEIRAEAASMDPLLQLADQFSCLDYDFVRLERLGG